MQSEYGPYQPSLIFLEELSTSYVPCRANVSHSCGLYCKEKRGSVKHSRRLNNHPCRSACSYLSMAITPSSFPWTPRIRPYFILKVGLVASSTLPLPAFKQDSLMFILCYWLPEIIVFLRMACSELLLWCAGSRLFSARDSLQLILFHSLPTPKTAAELASAGSEITHLGHATGNNTYSIAIESKVSLLSMPCM